MSSMAQCQVLSGFLVHRRFKNCRFSKVFCIAKFVCAGIQQTLDGEALDGSMGAQPAPAANDANVVFSQGLMPPVSLGPKPTFDQIHRLVDKFQQVAKNVIPITVVRHPGEVPSIQPPIGTKPSGALVDGRIYLFSDNLRFVVDAKVTLFHEVFHLGLQKVIPSEVYAAVPKQFSRNVLVQRFVRAWKDSPEGMQRAAPETKSPPSM
jgi:hypothetical protein